MSRIFLLDECSRTAAAPTAAPITAALAWPVGVPPMIAPIAAPTPDHGTIARKATEREPQSDRANK